MFTIFELYSVILEMGDYTERWENYSLRWRLLFEFAIAH